MTSSSLPDPDFQPEFYDSVPTKRLLAWGIDSLLVVLMTIVSLPFTAFTGLFFFPVLWMLVGFAYRTLSLGILSATVGMLLLSIELRTKDGKKFSVLEGFLHTLGYTVSFSSGILQLASVATILTSRYKQSLTDMLLGTVALNKRH